MQTLPTKLSGPLVIAPAVHGDERGFFVETYRRHTLAPDLNGPVDLAKVYAFLASDDSRGINGETIRVDGGLLAHQPFVPDMTALGAATATSQ